MNPPAPIPLLQAMCLAEQVRDQLSPLCLPGRCEIVGSIRRAREYVNDLDFALIPRDAASLRARILQRTTPVSDGPDILRVRTAKGLALEFFFARDASADLLETPPSNWASVFVCRTGSKEHNIYLASRARELGLKWETMRGLVVVEPSPGRVPGQLLKTEAEEDFFAALNLDFIPPVLRER
jgi:DNA polymerase/3'-5' exonuclease PolX